MFYRKRTYRRPVRRRRPARRRVARRMPRPRQMVYNFKRTCELNNLTTVPGVAPTLFQYQFKLSDVPGYGDFTQLYDQYRIKGVRITFYPAANTSYTGSSSSMPIGEFYTVLDFDDSTLPANIEELNQYQTLRRTYFNRPHKRYFKPLSTQSGVYQSGGVTTGYRSLPSSTWFDCGNPNILYYGIKGAYTISESSLVVKETIRVTATYYFQLRMVR